MSVELIVLVVVVTIAALAALLLAYLTAHRLDRLHIRTDLARAALSGALEQRHTVAAGVVRDLSARDPTGADRLARALAHARAHPTGAVTGPDGELAENTLGVVLSGVDSDTLPEDLAAELEDATDRVSMARRFYNDAVRDTRTLREQAPVRVLRLAGRAPMPGYVELVDGPPPQA